MFIMGTQLYVYLNRKHVASLTDRPDMTIDVYRGRKTTSQQKQQTLSGSKQVCVTELLLKKVVSPFEFNDTLIYACVDLLFFSCCP